jgi:hypothetical protein
MKKPTITFVLIFLSTVILLCFFSEIKAEKRPPVKEDIDSLIRVIRRDTVHHIVGVVYDRGDGSLFITVSDDTASTRYFNETYHIRSFPSIDGIKILNIHNRELATDSKRGDALLANFRSRWCKGNECFPLTERIKQCLKAPESYVSQMLTIDWVGDNSFIVTNTFQSRGVNGALKSGTVQAQIDLTGKILVYNEKTRFR